MEPPRPPTPAPGDAPRLRPGLQLTDKVSFPAELPISAHVIEIANAIDEHQVIIVAGETGSGKTTQLPKICLAMGRGGRGQIGCTQPRRLAATSVATRVAQELDTPLGEVVGYKVRFGDKVGRGAYIKFMTDGILLAELQGDPLLRRYDTIILDEAHERSLNIDFLLGFIKQLLPRRPDLRVIISSATLETARFSAFFGGAPVIGVSGRTFPVEVLYRPPGEDEADLAEAVASAVNEIVEMDPRGGDILVFLPGEREIREALGELEQRALPHTVLLPLYARLSVAEQQRVFQRVPQRRVVLATNVAETSLTIPGIVYVVDAGVARVNRYSVRTGVSQLLVEPISRASADQRKGRCGRTASGICVRLYEEQDYASRPEHTDPEIKRVGLAGVILRMKMLRLGELAHFPFLDPPQARAIAEGTRVLEELGALDERGDLTTLGEQLGRLPIDPRLGRMVLGGRDEGALREVVIIAAVLGLADPRDRPAAAQQRADEAHRKFRDEGSDFAAYLKLWEFWTEARARLSRRALQRLCRDSFLSYNRMREWDDVHEQLVRVMKELELRPNAQPASAAQLHRALLPGLLSKIGMWNQETRAYVGARQLRFVIHPSSGLARRPPPWVMAAELVETSQLFARTVARIEPEWIEAVALSAGLCKRSHGDPHWEQKQAQVMAREQVTLFGLPVVKSRSVAYARFDPARCRELFITHALVRGEFASRGRFMAHNQQLAAEAQRLRDKARRGGMFTDEQAAFDFFDQRLPASVVSGRAFEDWRAQAEAREPRVLFLTLDHLLQGDAVDLAPAHYPDQLVIGGVTLPLSYRFDTSADDDGVTVTVPLAALPQLDPATMAWTIPGWHQAKILALLESLPKAQRKAVAGAGSIEARAIELATAVRPWSGPMLPTLERAVHELTGERIGRAAWDLRAVPAYLDFTYRVVDEHDKELATGRDLAELQRTLGAKARAVWSAAPREAFERAGLRDWSVDTLPASVSITVGGRTVLAFPALVDTEQAVDLRLLESAAAAEASTRLGLRRLYLLQAGTTLKKLAAPLPGAIAVPWRLPLVTRAVDEAFGLCDPDPAALPRDRAAFTARLVAGRAALGRVQAELIQLATDLAAELARARAAVAPLVGKPGLARAVADDVQSQLASLAPAELWRVTPSDRLPHLVRYARALVIRLQRQAHDPQKDQQKAAPVVALWQQFLGGYQRLRAAGRSAAEVDALRWLIEELRVQVFAPELKTPVPVSLARVQEVWAALQ